MNGRTAPRTARHSDTPGPLARGVAMIAAAASLALTSAAFAQRAPAAEAGVRAVEDYNLDNKSLALEGYDPVAYFSDGGGEARKGKKSITASYRGVTYRFANEANRDRFRADPPRYEPAFGGWCAYAMANDQLAEIDPKSFLIQDGRLLVFYKDWFNVTRDKWREEGPADLLTQADGNWHRRTGERPGGAAASVPSVQERLDELKARFLAAAPADRARIYDDGIREVAASAVMRSALRSGDQAPDFTLPNAASRPVSLSSLRADGPVVLVWYRGGWCPYCNIQLRTYQEALPEFERLGARLVAISPELPDSSLSTKQKNELEFEVLSDAGNNVAESFGLKYRLPEAVIEQFRGRLDLPGANGDDSWTLPLSVVYVIGTDGTIGWSFIDADYRVRAEPAAIIEALEDLR